MRLEGVPANRDQAKFIADLIALELSKPRAILFSWHIGTRQCRQYETTRSHVNNRTGGIENPIPSINIIEQQ